MAILTSRALAASFVVTVAASGCTPRSTTGTTATDAIGGGPKAPRGFSSFPSSLHRRGERCTYMESGSCPSPESGGTCNPPPPITVECPPEADASPTAKVTSRPAGKEKWLHALAELNVSKWGCSFQPARFCPAVGEYGPCDNVNFLTLSCQIAGANLDAGSTPHLKSGVMPQTPEGKHGWFYVEGFSYTNVWGKCQRVDARWCEESKCAADEGVPCDAPPKTDGGSEQTNGKKDCWRDFTVTCEPHVKCNPPPPQKVDCPPGTKPGTHIREQAR